MPIFIVNVHFMPCLSPEKSSVYLKSPHLAVPPKKVFEAYRDWEKHYLRRLAMRVQHPASESAWSSLG